MTFDSYRNRPAILQSSLESSLFIPVEASNVHKVIRALTPLSRVFLVNMYSK